MQSSGRRFGWMGLPSTLDLWSETETLSQAIRAPSTGEEPEPDNVLFGTLQGTVVGLRYYTGVVNRGEMVSLVRQPSNQYDRNAVMVANVYGSQVGHIKRELAAAMAYVMDNNLARVEGVVPSAVNNMFTMPVLLSFWGREENKDAVLKKLGNHGYRLGPMVVKGSMVPGRGSGSRAPSMKSIPLTAEELENAFDRLFENLVEDKNGEKEAAEAVCTPLMPHQKQALSWMCVCENSSALPPFWEERGALFYNTLTYSSVRERPQRSRGGILADDMGLGKTLTTIALILTNFHQGKPLPLEKCEQPSRHPKSSTRAGKNSTSKGKSGEGDHTEEPAEVVCEEEVVPPKKAKGSSSKRAKSSTSKKEVAALQEDQVFAAVLSGLTEGGPPQKRTPGVEATVPNSAEDPAARATLILCPMSVLSNWLDQFEQHVRGDMKLSVYLYYGSERNRDPSFLSKQDVVLATYNVLSADYGGSGSGSPLHAVNWLRVVLDEGHVIRNPNAQQSRAVLELCSNRRWILSGTPIQNSLKDLWMLLAFLRLKPFDVKEWWNRVIQRPVTQGDRTGLQNLQALVKCVTLRRTKASQVCGRPLVSLPDKTVCVEHVTLTDTEREEYELARTEGRTTISRYVAEGSVLRNYADVLAILVRLRQFCCHRDLLGKITTDLGEPATPAELRERLIEKLRLVLASGSDEECSVCLDSIRLPVITHCAHVYCRPCIAQVIRSEQEQARCPLCRGQIKGSELVEFPQEVEEEENRHSQTGRTSSKAEALMANLFKLRSEDSSIKSLVVSQFTRFLTLLEAPLREAGFSFVRLDGTMTQKKRAQIIQEFQSPAPDSPMIMLLSLKAGGVGLNLTAASRVFLMDPAWNPAAEDQCVDRCHRLGQKRDVFITKFIVKDSVEENMVRIQRQKQDLVDKAFGSKNPTDKKASRINEIKALMEL